MHSLKTLHDSRRTRTLPQTRLHAYALSSRNTPCFPFAASALASAGSITGRMRAADASTGPGKRMAGPQPSARRWETQTIVVASDTVNGGQDTPPTTTILRTRTPSTGRSAPRQIPAAAPRPAEAASSQDEPPTQSAVPLRPRRDSEASSVDFELVPSREDFATAVEPASPASPRTQRAEEDDWEVLSVDSNVLSDV